MTDQKTRLEAGTAPACLLKTADTSTQAQIWRLIEVLRVTSPTTVELRDDHNLMQPAARVKTLRDLGWKIATIREPVLDAQGRRHCGVARYVLVNEGARP